MTMSSRLTDYVRDLVPKWRRALSRDEEVLGIHLRGNDLLYKAIRAVIEARIAGRAGVPEPTDPLVCKSMLARDRELQWLLHRLELVFDSPPPAGDTRAEPPG